MSKRYRLNLYIYVLIWIIPSNFPIACMNRNLTAPMPARHPKLAPCPKRIGKKSRTWGFSRRPEKRDAFWASNTWTKPGIGRFDINNLLMKHCARNIVRNHWYCYAAKRLSSTKNQKVDESRLDHKNKQASNNSHKFKNMWSLMLPATSLLKPMIHFQGFHYRGCQATGFI